jgi:hypothetical protein
MFKSRERYVRGLQTGLKEETKKEVPDQKSLLAHSILHLSQDRSRAPFIATPALHAIRRMRLRVRKPECHAGNRECTEQKWGICRQI